MATWLNRKDRYGIIAITLHWVIAIIVIFMLFEGNIMTGLHKSDPMKPVLYNLHKPIGLLVLAMMIWRTVNRLWQEPEMLPMPRWNLWLVKVTHYALYALLWLMPLTGWLMASVSKRAPKLFGYALNLPIDKDLWGLDLKFLSQAMHGIFAKVLIALILLHFTGTLKHLVYDRVNILRRMWYMQ